MMVLVRKFLGFLILFFDKVFQPKSLKRSEAKQLVTDAETSKFALYQFRACPFCVKVRRSIKRLNLKIELRDASEVPRYKEELIKEGGQYQTPCLKIDHSDGSVQWLYESADIIKFLEDRFAH